MTYRERAREELRQWFRKLVAEQAQQLADEKGLDLVEAEALVLRVVDALARAQFERSRAGYHT